MRLSRRRSGRLEVEDLRLPLIALIDVVLFLLFYFIIAGTMAGAEAELPTALGTSRSGQGQSSSLQPQVLSIVWVTGSGGAHAEYKMGQRTMRERRTLANVLNALPKDVGIIIRPSPDVPVEATATAIQLARDAGFRRISYASGS
ncbi:MAG TPA: biopolymer transporter ExbD [Phycisphaerales bacterium]|nr:biopolymer transporter ExbD [Phycisphaerales bacterium]